MTSGRKDQNMEGIRLNKYLSEMGVCSRREADRLAEAGKILIDGKPAAVGSRVLEGQQVVCNGKRVGAERSLKEPGAGNVLSRPKPVLLAVNKPRGVVCTTSQKDRAMNIVELVRYPERVYPIGRLDKDSEGLIFLTNQGDLVNQMMKGQNGHQKEYVVTVNKPLTAAFIEKMEAGVYLTELKVTTRPCKAWITGKQEFTIILTQGLNRQIRRMCGELGYQVQRLRRVRIMNVKLGNLKTGTFRKVAGEEYETLLAQLKEGEPGD